MNLEDEMLQRITDRREAKRLKVLADSQTEVCGSDDLRPHILKGKKHVAKQK